MRPGGQKAKGNAGEIKIAKELSHWLTQGQRADVLERAPSSGAKATSLAKSGQLHPAIAGDIIAVSEEGYPLTSRVLIECKHHKNINVSGLIFGTTQKDGLVGFWQKLCRECQQFNKLPMLIARQNYKPVIMGLSKEGIALFNVQTCVIAIFSQPIKNLYILYYDTFLQRARVPTDEKI